MLGNTFVIDAVVHPFNYNPRDWIAQDYARRISEGNYWWQRSLMGDGPYTLDQDEHLVTMNADTLAHTLFVESPTDVGVHHTIPAWGVFKDLSPLSVSLEIGRRYPGRMFYYPGVSPLEGTKAIEDLHRYVEEVPGMLGVKLYPVDFISGRMRTFLMNDEKVVYPVLEACQKLGIKNVAIHKAVPIANAPVDCIKIDDVDHAALAFPEINFSVVHSGYAFLDEAAYQAGRYDNVYVNLECTISLVMNQPRQFTRILGTFLYWAGAKKLIYASGCSLLHPTPGLKAFETFQFPQDMVEGYGYPQLTDEDKALILGGNFARIHELDIGKLYETIKDDELSRLRREHTNWIPWDRLPNRKRANVPAGVYT